MSENHDTTRPSRAPQPERISDPDRLDGEAKPEAGRAQTDRERRPSLLERLGRLINLHPRGPQGS